MSDCRHCGNRRAFRLADGLVACGYCSPLLAVPLSRYSEQIKTAASTAVARARAMSDANVMALFALIAENRRQKAEMARMIQAAEQQGVNLGTIRRGRPKGQVIYGDGI